MSGANMEIMTWIWSKSLYKRQKGDWRISVEKTLEGLQWYNLDSPVRYSILGIDNILKKSN